MRRPLIAVALAGAALAAAPAQAGTTKTVKVVDNFFSPTKVTVNPGTQIRWRWTTEGGDVHDVKLTSGPKGVKKFTSEPASGPYTYRRTLRASGTYRILCTFHEDDGMRMTVTVRKRR